MVNNIKYFIYIPLLIFLISCSSQKEQIIIVSEKENQEAGKELAMYLSKTYSDLSFQVSEKINEGEKNIILKTVSGEKIVNDEQFQI